MNQWMLFLKQKLLFFLLICLLIFIGFASALAGEKPGTKSIEQLLAAACPDLNGSCIQKELENFWKKADVKGRYDICRYLYSVDGNIPDVFLTTKLRTSLDPLVKGFVVNFLVLRHRQSNLPTLIGLLTDCSVSNREGDRVCSNVLGDLQATVPLEYKFDEVRFDAETSYRALIQSIYETWHCIASQMGRLEFNKRDKIFAFDEVSDEMLREHQIWFIQGCKNGSEPLELLRKLRERLEAFGKKGNSPDTHPKAP